jgi:hypothetical protein
LVNVTLNAYFDLTHGSCFSSYSIIVLVVCLPQMTKTCVENWERGVSAGLAHKTRAKNKKNLMNLRSEGGKLSADYPGGGAPLFAV